MLLLIKHVTNTLRVNGQGQENKFLTRIEADQKHIPDTVNQQIFGAINFHDFRVYLKFAKFNIR